MKNNIEFRWILETSGEEKLTYFDLGTTEEDWNQMVEEEKEVWIEEYIKENIGRSISIYPTITYMKTL